MSLVAGTRLGPYEIVSAIGAGGMGEVYRARDARIGRDVAVKVLPAAIAKDPERVRRFEQEVRAVGALNHPNILTIHDVGTHEGSPYIVSELLEGETLRGRLRGGALAWRKAVDYALQTSRGLTAAHQKGIAHRDLKPENLFVTTDGRVKILDFGLAKLIQREATAADSSQAPTVDARTEAGTVLGTVGYMSPEQVQGRPLDHRTDLFSLGAVLYEMLSGRRAFQRDSPLETMHAILKDDPEGQAGMPVPLERIVRHCLEKNPEERFQSARDLAFDLESLTAVSAVVATPTARRSRLGWLAAAVVIVVACAAVVMFWPRGGVDPASYRYTPLATGAGIEVFPSWSLDGKSIAYSGEVDGVFQIFTRSLDSAMPAQITRSAEDCFFPFWSRDGARVYYISGPVEKQNLWLVGAAGGAPDRVLENISKATISPDGKALAILRRDAGQDYSVWISSPPGANPVKYTERPFADRRFFSTAFLHFSPDGSKIGVWVSLWEGRSEFWVLPYPSGAPYRFDGLPVSQLAGSFTWMPDGRVVFGGAGSLAASHLGIADAKTTRPLTAGVGREATPAVSPDGEKLAFASLEQDYDLVEIPLDGFGVRPLLATPRNEYSPSWSPTGSQLVYATDRSGSLEIWLRSQQEGWERPLVTHRDFQPATTLFDPVFAPDGQRVAYRRLGADSEAIWISTLAGGAPVRLAREPENFYQRRPTWSPDGNWIAYNSVRGGKSALVKARVGGSESPTVLAQDVGLYTRWSPKDDWIACAGGSPGLTLISPDGTSSRVISPKTWLSHGWSKDGAVIYGLQRTDNRRLALVSLDVRSEKERVVADLGAYPAALNYLAVIVQAHPLSFSLHPDGKRFVVAMSRARSDIWLLEGFQK